MFQGRKFRGMCAKVKCKLKINQIKKIGQYLREISVVVIGVALTLSASVWITNRNEKKDLALYLNTIKLELEENIRLLDENNIYVIQPALKYADYLRSHDKKSLNLDSLKYHILTVYNMTSITIKTSAFDMFKTSGFMRLTDNKDLLLSVWDSYTTLVDVKRIFDKYSDMKTEEAKKYFSSYGNNPSDEDMLKHPPLYEIYVDMPIYFVQNANNKRARELLEKTISMFDSAK